MSKKKNIIKIPRQNFYLLLFFVWLLSSVGTIGFLNIASHEKTNTQLNAATAKCATSGGTCKTLALCSQGGGISAGTLDCASGANLGGIVCCKPKAATKTKPKPKPKASKAPSKAKCATAGGLCKTLALCSKGGGKSLGAMDCASGANLGGVVCCRQTTASKKSACITSGGVCKTSALCSQGGGVSSGVMDCASGANLGGVVCCKSSAQSQSNACKKAGGSCRNLNECNGTIKKGLCPGGTDNVCCLPSKKSGSALDDSKGRPQPKLKVPDSGQKSTECKDSGGTCYDSSTQQCSGATRTFAEHYMCPGGWNNVCCIGGTVDAITNTKQTSCERQGGQCGDSSKYTCTAGFKPGLCSGNAGCCRGIMKCKDKGASCNDIDTTQPSKKASTAPAPKPDQTNKQPKQNEGNKCLGTCVDPGSACSGVKNTLAGLCTGIQVCCLNSDQEKKQKPQPDMELTISAILDGVTSNNPPATQNKNITASLTFTPDLEGLEDQEKFAAKEVSLQGKITYDAASGNFKGSFPLKDVPDGTYQIILHIDKYLDKQLVTGAGSPLFIISSENGPNAAPVLMIAGDIAGNKTKGTTNPGDNAINVADWNLFIACFGKSPTGGCKNADLNLDGKVDEKDQEILIRNIGKNGSSLDKEEIVCEQDPACKQGAQGLQMCQLICTQKKVHHDFRKELLKQYEE